jgi:hypothetical protein
MDADSKKREIEAAARQAQLFAGGLVAGLNLTATLMHGLVAKNLMRRSDARILIDEAAQASARMTMPNPYEDSIAAAYAAIRKGFED